MMQEFMGCISDDGVIWEDNDEMGEDEVDGRRTGDLGRTGEEKRRPMGEDEVYGGKNKWRTWSGLIERKR
ncbi:hypothetical protein K1719_029285 [Acacia pycnantha]|nr:hypothetical protein K1719_029285 [Acacia pycnantha]